MPRSPSSSLGYSSLTSSFFPLTPSTSPQDLRKATPPCLPRENKCEAFRSISGGGQSRGKHKTGSSQDEKVDKDGVGGGNLAVLVEDHHLGVRVQPLLPQGGQVCQQVLVPRCCGFLNLSAACSQCFQKRHPVIISCKNEASNGSLVVLNSHMSFQTSRLSTRVVTLSTLVRFFTGVHTHMNSQVM